MMHRWSLSSSSPSTSQQGAKASNSSMAHGRAATSHAAEDSRQDMGTARQKGGSNAAGQPTEEQRARVQRIRSDLPSFQYGRDENEDFEQGVQKERREL